MAVSVLLLLVILAASLSPGVLSVASRAASVKKIKKTPVPDPPVSAERTPEEAVADHPVSAERTPEEAVADHPVSAERTPEEAVANPPVRAKRITKQAVANPPVRAKRITKQAVANPPVRAKRITKQAVANPPVRAKRITKQAVDGQWGSWDPWGPCSVTCGKHGLKIRTRACDDPAPANNGALCPDSCAEAAHCHSEPCPGRVREYKTCELSYGTVDTFGGISSIFFYHCLFKAATLGPFTVAGGHKLELDIYAAFKDTDIMGYIFVSEVNIVVREICLHPTTRTSRFSINSQHINNVFSGLNPIENPEDLWTVEDENAYKDYLCFGYEDGQVSFSMKKNKKSACTQVLTFMPLIPDAQKPPSLVIMVKEHQLSKHNSVRFPNSICSGRQDEAFDRPFKGLGNTRLKILYALLDQNVEQPESDPQCSDAVHAFQQSSEDDKKKAVEQCELANLEDLAACITHVSPR